jgi:hypothetical protein
MLHILSAGKFRISGNKSRGSHVFCGAVSEKIIISQTVACEGGDIAAFRNYLRNSATVHICL